MALRRFNHIGHSVADIDKARRFYEEVLGFVFDGDMQVSGDASARRLQVSPPLDLRVVYLKRDGFLLELLQFKQPGTDAPRRRALTEPGLTHLSVTVDDMDNVLAKAVELGGEVLEEIRAPNVAWVRDPDGQLVELLTPESGYHSRTRPA